MLLKKLCLTLILVIFFSFSAYSADVPSLSASSAVLINAVTKEIIYEKNAYTHRSMASTTKIMTGILAIESGRLSEIVTAKNMEAEGTSIGLKNGYRLTLEALVWGMMLESGNDAAKLTAAYLSGSEENFASLMNDKASEIGMRSTNFVTASGLDADEHYSTAYDMALLGAYAVSNPVFREICSAKTKRIEFIEPGIVRTFSNHNRLLSSCEGVFGIKTGFTKKSGRCLVTACEREGTVLVAVTLNAGDDWNDHRKLYDYGYDICEKKELFISIPDGIKVYGGICDNVRIRPESNPISVSLRDKSCDITQQIYLPEFIYAPIKKGDILGEVQLIKDGRVISESSIISSEDIPSAEPLPEKKSIFSKIKEIFNRLKG